MAENPNARNQQILGLLSLVGNGLVNNNFGKVTPQTKDGVDQTKYLETQKNARASIRRLGIEKPSMTYVQLTPPLIFDRMVDTTASSGGGGTAAGATEPNSTIVVTGQKAMPDATTWTNEVNFRAERVTQPGIQIATSNSRRYGVGPTVKKPYAAGFNDISVSFIGDSQGIIHQFFYTWMTSIVGVHDLPDIYSRDIFGKQPYEVEYRDNYKTIMDIIMYDEVQTKISTVRLHDVYPVALGEIQRDWGGVNDLVRVPITFTFSHWTYVGKILNMHPVTQSTIAESKKSLLTDVVKGMTALQALTSIKRPQNINDVINVVNSGSTMLQSFYPRRMEY